LSWENFGRRVRCTRHHRLGDLRVGDGCVCEVKEGETDAVAEYAWHVRLNCLRPFRMVFVCFWCFLLGLCSLAARQRKNRFAGMHAVRSDDESRRCMLHAQHRSHHHSTSAYCQQAVGIHLFSPDLPCCGECVERRAVPTRAARPDLVCDSVVIKRACFACTSRRGAPTRARNVRGVVCACI